MKTISDQEFNKGLPKEISRLVKWVDKTRYPPSAYFELILSLLIESKRMGYYDIIAVLEDAKLTFFKEFNESQEQEDED